MTKIRQTCNFEILLVLNLTYLFIQGWNSITRPLGGETVRIGVVIDDKRCGKSVVDVEDVS